jgi:uncharacterized protein
LILVDANLLIYAHVEDFAEHEGARTWLDAHLVGTARVGLPWPSLMAFLRIVTNPRVFAHPESMPDAWCQVRDWLGAPAAWVPTPTSRHADVYEALVPSVTRATLVPDAHLAALAIDHGLTLCSTDGDFARFPGLRWKNPLAPP